MTTACTVVGEALVDLVESHEHPGTFSAHAGGSPYNVAVTLGRLGQQVSLAARTGRDAFGRVLEDKARASGISFDSWQIVDQPTTLAVATLDERKRAHYLFYLDSTAGFGWDESIVDLVTPATVLHLGSLSSWRPPSERVLHALQKRAVESGSLVSYDPNVRTGLIGEALMRTNIERCIESAHLIKVSDDDIEVLYPGEPVAAVAARWCELGATLVVVTLGEGGAEAFGAAGELASRPGMMIDVADTVGAGDSFAGGLLTALGDSGLCAPDALASAVAESDPRIGDALQRAVVVSAITCERHGADPPTRAELDDRLAAVE